jgi:3D (Asp-Asp-Asp) domain-containing protein
MNTVPLGTRIEIRPAAFGRRYFTVNDRIGSGSELDIFTPNCQQAVNFGRRLERVRVLGKVK